jgi:Icc-related predicted phosphoesterase
LDTDVLITHGPAHGIRDLAIYGNSNQGCTSLRMYVLEKIKPALHVFGHIHHAHGGAIIKDTLFVNASICNESYQPANKPIIIELTEYYGEIVATYIEE